MRKLLILTILSSALVLPSSVLAGPELLGLSKVVFPVMGPRLSSTYGPRKHPVRRVTRHHNGVDLAAPKNAHVRAMAEGKIIFAGSYKGYGKLVTIYHGNEIVSLYGHLNEILVESGENVTAGQVIGRVGSTGLATGPHLHFEWRKNGKSVDPLKIFPSLAKDASG